jgi:hypothetical protein
VAPTIDWRGWTEAAFGAASTENKPILLSIVTAWSDECSAMEATTYAQPDVVAMVGGRFIPVRVDADRRPDVNERYNLGGWPTTAVLTPEGHVLNGGTYFGRDGLIALLSQAADSWRDRADDIRARVRVTIPATVAPDSQPDGNAVGWFRSLLIDEFDLLHGGFGTAAKYPHGRALEFAIAMADEESDEQLRRIAESTLDGIGALWDPDHGGFYRYAERSDWSRPGTEKTLEDNAALLNLYLDAAVRLRSDQYQNRAGELVRWIKTALADQAHGGFYNGQAAVSRELDRSMYVDRNADMVAAFLRAADIFQDPWLRDYALKSFEAVVVPGYKPGGGVAHERAGPGVAGPADAPPARGLLGDQVRVALAVTWAHVVTGQLPYSMLALELVQFAVRTMWDAPAKTFRDRASETVVPLGLLAEPVRPFAVNCDAACVLDRLATMTGDDAHRDRALAILGSLAGEYQAHGLFGAPYALAVREVVERRPPLGLNLSRVEWNLEQD